jgi:hypothetical protein
MTKEEIIALYNANPPRLLWSKKELIQYPKSKRYELKGMYRCYCGKEFYTRVADMERGKIKSCGCFFTSIVPLSRQ